MDQALSELLQHGILGLVAALFVYLYMHERAKNTELQNKLIEREQHNYSTLDKIRESQIKREQEVAQTLEGYGKGVLEAVHHSTVVVEELRRLYDGRG